MNHGNFTNKINFIEPENPLFKEAADLATKGILEQQKGNYDTAKQLIQEGISKLKEITVKGRSEEREKAMNFYSIFQSFITNCTTQQENEKIAMESNITQALVMKEKNFITGNNDNFQNLLKKYSSINIKHSSPDVIFEFTTEILKFFSKAHDKGFFWSKDIFIRSEIFKQDSAQIPFIFQKYEAYLKVSEKLSSLKIVADKNVINRENVESFINLLIDMQFCFSKELKYIPHLKYRKNVENELEKNRTIAFYKNFQEIKDKITSGVKEEKIKAVKDYIGNFANVCNEFMNLKEILEHQNLKREFANKLEFKKIEICEIFYSTIIKWFIRDMLDLTSRFLKKQIMIFESYNVSV